MINFWSHISPLMKGIICILLSALGFSLMALFMRLAGELPLAEKAIFRNAITALISGYIIWRNKQSFLGQAENRTLLLLRSITGLLGILCGVYIIDHLVLSDVDMIGKLTSFILIVFSAVFLKEKASYVQWGLCLSAFVGALFIIKPAFEIKFFPYVIGIIGAVFAALAYLCLRLLGKRAKPETSNTIVFFFSAFSTIVLLPFVFLDFVPITAIQFNYLLLSGITATVGQFCVTLAYKYAAAKDISIYSYASVLFSAFLGATIFEQFPDGWSVLGYLIIFSSGFLMFMFTRTKRKI
ncbi:DMT family transporter [Actinobacillus pleuropneumoniae]|uniref:DMT family transporter n=1 Tax=Actinobacillus pleuropneumoniae TaxID=715 RepID=UPI003D062EC9